MCPPAAGLTACQKILSIQRLQQHRSLLHSFYMRTFAALISLIWLAACATGITAAAIKGCSNPGLCGASEDVSIIQRTPVSQPRTNAERFVRGLPPLPPSRSRRYNGTPVRRTGASPVPMVTYTGHIELLRNDNTRLGYIASTSPSLGAYQYQTTFDNQVLQVHFNLPPTSTQGSQIDIVADNSQVPGASTKPLLGVATASGAILQNGDFALGLLVAIMQTPPGSEPQEGILASDWSGESAVWSIDLSSGDLSTQWINPGGTATSTSLTWLVSGANTLLQFGDPSAWSQYGLSLTPVKLRFVVSS